MNTENRPGFSPRKVARNLTLAGTIALGSLLAGCGESRSQEVGVTDLGRNLCDLYGQTVTIHGQIGDNQGAIVDGSSRNPIVPIRTLYTKEGDTTHGYIALRGDKSPFQNPPPINQDDFRVLGPVGERDVKHEITTKGTVTRLGEPNHPIENTCVITTT